MKWTHNLVNRSTCLGILVLVFVASGQIVSAGPYPDTGDIELRHDLEYLADRSLISVPITTWPISWVDIASAVDSVDRGRITDAATITLLNRLKNRVANNAHWGNLETSYSIGLNDNQSQLRSFDDRPSGTVELEGRLEYIGRNFVADLRLGLADESGDPDTFRLDGSYLGYIFGNVAVTLGSQDAWWGPGHAGSLILSSNARPVPGIALRRNTATRFQSRWLSWIGPWTAHAFAGRLESDRPVSQPYLLGARVAIKPIRSLELGVSRTAQWGGDGRPETLRSLINLVIGRDNAGDGISREEEPGNQLAGFDARWSLAGFGAPVTLYGQLIGEDEAGGFPSRYLGQGGVSGSFAIRRWASTARINLEYSDTTCQFNESSKLFNCAYNNGLYPAGYRYRGRAIGHSTDNDSSQLAVIATLNTAGRQSWQMTLRSGRLNRGGPVDLSNTLASSRVDFVEFDIGHSRPFFGGKAELGVGFKELDNVAADDTSRNVNVYLRWNSTMR